MSTDLKQQINAQWQKARTYLGNMSGRERGLIALAFGCLLLIAVWQICQSVNQAFAAQRQKLAQLDQDAQNLAPRLERYLKSKSRRDAIENRYKAVEIREGALSYLEALIKGKGGIEPGRFTIKDSQPRPFANNYEQVSYVIVFNTTNMETLSALLKEIIEGAKPLVLSKLDLTRSGNADALKVEMEVSSIRSKQG